MLLAWKGEQINMRKRILLLLAVLMAASFIWGCDNKNSDVSYNTEINDDKIHIVATIFPEYDWIKNIIGDNPGGLDVTMLLESGVDLHNFQASAEDILKVASCDVFIYIGGESDFWVKDALKESVNDDMIVLNLIEILGDKAKVEELAEGMQDDEHDDVYEEESTERENEEEHAEEDDEYDEHIWLSLKNAVILCESIEEAIGKVDPENASIYRSNLESYINELNALDDEYKEAISQGNKNTLLFADRFPFRYLVDDYGLNYYAAFKGCSAETEASFETITFLTEKVNELGLDKVLVIEGRDHKIADTIIQNTERKNQDVLTLNSMQGITINDVESGASYLGIMRDNLKIIEEALK